MASINLGSLWMICAVFYYKKEIHSGFNAVIVLRNKNVLIAPVKEKTSGFGEIW